jgi:hypothetical protein
MLLPLFCFPNGVKLQALDDQPLPTFFPFVLTEGDGEKLFAACFTFHDKAFVYEHDDSDDDSDDEGSVKDVENEPADITNLSRDDGLGLGDIDIGDFGLPTPTSTTSNSIPSEQLFTQAQTPAAPDPTSPPPKPPKPARMSPTAVSSSPFITRRSSTRRKRLSSRDSVTSLHSTDGLESADTARSLAAAALGSLATTTTTAAAVDDGEHGDAVEAPASSAATAAATAMDAPKRKSKPKRQAKKKLLTKNGTPLYEPKCICLLSRYPYFTQFKRFLLHLYALSLSHPPQAVGSVLQQFMSVRIPPSAGLSREVWLKMKDYSDDKLVCRVPQKWGLPLVDITMGHLFKRLSVPNILTVLALLLKECSIVLLSHHDSVPAEGMTSSSSSYRLASIPL